MKQIIKKKWKIIFKKFLRKIKKIIFEKKTIPNSY